MRKFFFAVLVAIAISAQAQNNYDDSFKYHLGSNVGIYPGATFSYSLGENHKSNLGAQLMLTKRLGNNWRVRGLVGVNGLIPNGFDRYGKAMLGLSFDLLPFYLYCDYGVNYNPSGQSRFGLALDGGAGLQFRTGKYSLVYLQGGADLVNNGLVWQSNLAVTGGVAFELGPTERDRQNKSIDDNMRSTYGELKQENQLLRSEVKKATDTNEQMQTVLDKYVALYEQAEQRFNECNAERVELKNNTIPNAAFYPILFLWGSYEILPEMDYIIADMAEQMKREDCSYRVIGYCSNNGTDWKNEILSSNRARSVYDRLIYYGVGEDRLYPEGRGVAERDNPAEQRVIIERIQW